MVHSTEELIEAANSWLEQGVSDLRQNIEGFMAENGISDDELADALGLSEDEVANVLNGNAESISLKTFAHILIANNLALVIKPIGEIEGGMPRPVNGGRMPMGRPGRMPMGPGRMPMGRPGRIPMGPGRIPVGRPGRMPMGVGGHGEPTPFPNGMPTAMPKPSNGGFGGQADPYSRLSDMALRDVIVRNHWNYEIDVEHATRAELIDFLKNKERITLGGTPENRPVREARPNVHVETNVNNEETVVEPAPVVDADGEGDTPDEATTQIDEVSVEDVRQAMSILNEFLKKNDVKA